jgi:hypothetical protein
MPQTGDAPAARSKVKSGMGAEDTARADSAKARLPVAQGFSS